MATAAVATLPAARAPRLILVLSLSPVLSILLVCPALRRGGAIRPSAGAGSASRAVLGARTRVLRAAQVAVPLSPAGRTGGALAFVHHLLVLLVLAALPRARIMRVRWRRTRRGVVHVLIRFTVRLLGWGIDWPAFPLIGHGLRVEGGTKTERLTLG